MADYIQIILKERRLYLYRNNLLRAVFPVAIGKTQTPTPVGNWQVINKKILTEPGVFGTRWIGLDNPGYGIHGTNTPEAIGSAVSMGCIRMYNADVEQLFDLVFIGMPVIIAADSMNRCQLSHTNRIR
ncbi:MAG: L,D-transpeptidase [Peptococcaceae bacterium]|nr:L,D-transpeptidase [Peptococcaceae bacterium]